MVHKLRKIEKKPKSAIQQRIWHGALLDDLPDVSTFTNVGVEENRLLQPEMQLMMAVLKDAIAHRKICTWRKCNQCVRDKEWANDKSGRYLFSFIQICMCLNIESEATRAAFLRMQPENNFQINA